MAQYSFAVATVVLRVCVYLFVVQFMAPDYVLPGLGFVPPLNTLLSSLYNHWANIVAALWLFDVIDSAHLLRCVWPLVESF